MDKNLIKKNYKKKIELYNYYNKKYQITNPDYVTLLENQAYVTKNIPKYKTDIL